MSFDNIYLDTREKWSQYSPNIITEKIQIEESIKFNNCEIQFNNCEIQLLNNYETQIIFEKLGTLECALKYKDDNPVCLNFANPILPCWDIVDEYTQEEDLFRRTTLGNSLKHNLYPIHNDIIISKNICVFKSGQMDGYYSLLDKLYFINIISCSALMYPEVNNKDRYKNKEDYILTQNKISNILSHSNKISNTLITGAWGCGAFENPITDICEIWNKEIEKCSLKKVIFAIPDTKTYDKFYEKMKI